MNKLTLIVSVAALFVALSGCNEQAQTATSDSNSEGSTSSAGTDRVAYEQVEAGSLMDLYMLPAEVVIPTEAAVQGGLSVSFRVESWKVSTGQDVEMGDEMAVVTSPDLRDLKSQLGRAQRVFREREALVEEQREAVEAGFQSTQSLYEARASLAEARGALISARSRLDERTQGQLERDGDRWSWVAPADGTIGEITCSTGQLLAAGASCFRLNTPARAEVRVPVPERFLEQVDSETTATWHTASKLHTEEGLPMILARRAPALDATSRTQAHFFRPDPDGARADSGQLRPGSSGRIELHVDARKGLVRVPKLAVTRIQGRDHVFKKTGDDTQEPVKVETHGQRGEDLLVAGDGLSAGDSVVSRGAFYLKSVLTFE
ncbi:MAG: efflux RND transporter periplasmic adaptor subunit [Myxococcota bacterium]